MNIDLHLLVNISSDTENHYGIRFLCSFFKGNDNCNVTLFHICRLDSSDSTQALTEMWEDPTNRIENLLSVGARRALDRATRTLKANKITIHKKKAKIVEERFGKVKDILAEGESGLYDAMILGRRATYALQWLYDRPADEIPQALIKDTSLSCPIWVCCDPEPGRKNVLLCVDGSASSLRAADHVGYILSSAKKQKVTVFNVATTPSDNSEEILQNAVEVLQKHNIDPNRISCKSTWAITAAGAILSEKSAGKYAAVAIGLHGLSDRKFANFGLLGGTTSTLLHKIVKASLWCCP